MHVKPPARSTDRPVLVIIDMQEKLAPAIDGIDVITAKTRLLAKAAQMLDIPILITEHYAKGLGRTLLALKQDAAKASYFAKNHFDACCEDDGILPAMRSLGRRAAVVCGCETHVCVMQTCLSLLAEGYYVFLPSDAAGSRFPADKNAALRRLENAGAIPASAEMIVFEWLKHGANPAFKALLPAIRSQDGAALLR